MKKPLISRLLVVALCSTPLLSLADVIDAKVSTALPKQYARVDIDINLRAQWRDPYNSSDVAVDVEFTTPSGKTLTLPAFYLAGDSNKNSHWQARFTPQEFGSYSYKIRLQDDGKLKKSINPSQFSVSTGDGKGFLHPNNLWSLKFDNGQVFRGVGENFCWEKRDTDDSKYFKALQEDPRFNYDDMLAKLSRNGSNFFRTWMIYWNLPVDWKKIQNASRYHDTTSHFNESGIARMDQLMDIAERNNMYMMLALESHVGLLGSGWETSSYNKRNGGFAETPQEFFSSPKAKAQYKDKLRFMVARWGYSPSIAMWEFFNEIDNVMYADKNAIIPDALITQWHQEMSGYLASIDPYQHIITTSISHRDVAGLNDIPSIQINQKHIYKATDAIPGAINKYVAQHNKPYIIGEAGYEWDWSKNFDEFSKGMISDFKRELWYGLFSSTPVLPMSWWWEYFDEKGMTPYFQRVNEINKAMLQASNGDLISVAVKADPALKTYAVKAGDKYFVYLFNPGDKAITTDIQLTVDSAKSHYQVQQFNPETGVYTGLPGVDKSLLSKVALGAEQDSIFILQ